MLVLRAISTIRNFSTKKSPVASAFPVGESTFSSPISLSNIYPKSNLDAYTPPNDLPTSPEPGKFNGFIPMNQLTITYARSGGPGGQHVNKTNTKTTISFHLASAEWIPESAREKLSLLVSSELTSFSLEN